MNLERRHALLEQRLGAGVTADPRVLERFSTDFGGMVRRPPSLVITPDSEDDVLQALQWCSQNGLPLCLRGAGHSQSGQGLHEGAVTLDLSRLERVIDLDLEAGFIEVTGGTRWRIAFDAAFAEGHFPLAPTYFADATVAGTLSVAGLGAQSWRYGAQVNNVLELWVATPEGQIVRCSPEVNRPLFDAVRGGLGQCGIILRVRYPLRPCGLGLDCAAFAYPSAGALVSDLDRLAQGTEPQWLTAFVEGRSFVLMTGSEAGDVPSVSGTKVSAFTSALWSRDGSHTHPFCRSGGEASGPSVLHPWVDHLFDEAGARATLERLAERPPTPMMAGTNVVIPLRRCGTPAPLFRGVREGGLTWGIGVFPNVAPAEREPMGRIMAAYSADGVALGGVRYLSGFFDSSTSSGWAAHFGSVWGAFKTCKAKFDPKGLLSSGALSWDSA